jgi:hypothetical protein
MDQTLDFKRTNPLIQDANGTVTGCIGPVRTSVGKVTNGSVAIGRPEPKPLSARSSRWFTLAFLVLSKVFPNYTLASWTRFFPKNHATTIEIA